MAAQRLHSLVEEQATRTPHAPAAFTAVGSLSYKELNERANCLAWQLLDLGVQPNDYIGLCVGRSLDMLVAILGILKAGAAYLPLDPTYPSDRLNFMLSDSGATIVVSQSAVAARLAGYEGQVILLAGIEGRVDSPQTNVQAEDLAYVMYTSGSTGRPKGVMIEHRSAARFVEWTLQTFSHKQTQHVLCANSLSFDVSVFEIFATLAAGGALVIVDTILDLLHRPPAQPISLLLATPSSLTEIVRARAFPPSLSTLIVGGERLTRSLADEIYTHSNVEALLNTWGVTEATICSTLYPVSRNGEEDPPVGLPIPTTKLYILDEELQEVAVNEVGELYCAGSGVARGYLHRPELHAQHFLKNPTGDSPLMYRTGDLVTRSADGLIRFVGRKDQQVKIQGLRIELGEIESVLAQHPGIVQAAVLVRPDSTMLDMYVVETEPHILNIAQIQDFVGERLPAHMIPARLMIVDAMPISPTGKLDRSALIHCTITGTRSQPEYTAPTNHYQTGVAALFVQLLGFDRVSINDNFFALGGKSLLAARLATELRTLYPQELAAIEHRLGSNVLQVAFAFEPTVRYLAAVIEGKETPPVGKKALQCIQKGKAGLPPLFVFHGVITGEAFYSYHLMHALGKDQPLYTLAPHGIDGDQVPETIEEMAQDYLRQLLEVQPTGTYHLIGYCNGGLVAFEVARMLRARAAHIATLILIASPGHNIRFRRLKSNFELLRFLPGWDETKRRAEFLKTREVLRLKKFQVIYAYKFFKAFSRGKLLPLEKPRDQYQRARRLGNQAQRNDPRYYGIIKAIDAYVPGTYDGPLCLLWGRDDQYLQNYDPYKQWSQLVPHAHFQLVEGGHTFLDSHPEFVLEHFPFHQKKDFV